MREGVNKSSQEGQVHGPPPTLSTWCSTQRSNPVFNFLGIFASFNRCGLLGFQWFEIVKNAENAEIAENTKNTDASN